ncbi:hypothetical protein [Streptomyces sp. NPDC048659]|uniref:hypothetical protein n=1 Tax=Streptomyces sp. NPDC048659 TaxID=3155489 RepID=UPI003413BAA9
MPGEASPAGVDGADSGSGAVDRERPAQRLGEVPVQAHGQAVGAVAVVTYTLRGREQPGMLRLLGDALVVQGLHQGDEIVPVSLASPDTDVTEHEIEGAPALMEMMSSPGSATS